MSKLGNSHFINIWMINFVDKANWRWLVGISIWQLHPNPPHTTLIKTFQFQPKQTEKKKGIRYKKSFNPNSNCLEMYTSTGLISNGKVSNNYNSRLRRTKLQFDTSQPHNKLGKLRPKLQVDSNKGKVS